MGRTDLVIPELGNKFVDYRANNPGGFTWSWERPITQVRYAAVHHTVTSKSATPEAIWALHKARNWGGIGYHFLCGGDGTVWYVGDISLARSNVANRNHEVLGCAMMGDFTQELPSDEQIDSMHKLIKWMIEVASIPGIDGWDKMWGHKDFNATACPGSSWQGAPDSMYERIKNNIPYTPQPPDPEPPDPHPDDKYYVVHQGETIASYDYNPADKINELTQKLENCGKELAHRTTQVAELETALAQQEADNADLQSNLRDCQRQKDELLAEKKSLERELADCQKGYQTCLTKLQNCQDEDKCMCQYSRGQLLRWGLFGKPDKCKE